MNKNKNNYVGAITDKIYKIDLYLTCDKDEKIIFKRGQHLKIFGEIEFKGMKIFKNV